MRVVSLLVLLSACAHGPFRSRAQVTGTWPSNAPDGKGAVSGTVRSPSGLPLAGATVIVTRSDGIQVVAVSDDLGHFQFSGLEAGTYVARFYFSHGEAESAPFELRGAQTVTLDATLDDTIGLEVDQAPPALSNLASTQTGATITQETIRALPR